MISLGPQDLRKAIAPMVAAFWDYPETVHLLPDEKRRRRVLPRYLLSDARDSVRFAMFFGSVDGGEIVGAAAWLPPDAYPVSLARQARQVVDLAPAAPWGWPTVREALRGQSANRAHHARFPPHFYLRAIGVAPDARGQGVGSSLIVPVIERADGVGVGCFLQTATADNVAWYERFGFDVAATYQPTPTWPTVWAMWREPS